MKALSTALVSGCLAFAAGTAFAADDMKKADGMMKKEDAMTLQQCKDHMAMANKAGTKKDDATMKKEEPMKK